MRVVLDTNILISALLIAFGDHIVDAWLDRKFVLLTRPAHLEELRATLRKPRVSALIRPHRSGRMTNQIRRSAEVVTRLPRVRRSPDPTDDYLLALAEVGKADYLVTGDKSGLLALVTHKSTQIVSAATFVRKFACRHKADQGAIELIRSSYPHAGGCWGILGATSPPARPTGELFCVSTAEIVCAQSEYNCSRYANNR